MFFESNAVKTRIGNILIAFLLLGVLVTPNINQWLHLAKNHHKEVKCQGNTLHFHQEESCCDLNANFVTPYTYVALMDFSPYQAGELPHLLQDISPIFQLIRETSFRLRGPPSLLFLS